MRFDEPLDDEDAPIRPKSILPSPNQASNAVRMRLLALFGLLIFVILAMKEAGKPERWEWMGFENSRNVEFDSDRGASESIDSNAKSGSSDNQSTLSTTISDSNLPAAQVKIEREGVPAKSITQESELPLILSNPENVDYPAAATAFWKLTFPKLGDDQQKSFLSLLNQMRHSKTVPLEQRESLQSLVKLIKQHRARFQQQLFDRLALTPDDSPEKTRLADELYESLEIWGKKVYPALNAAAQGEDFSIAQQQAIVRLQLAIDPLLYDQVQDKTSIGWSGDSGAWKRIWGNVVDGELSSPQPVTRIQLMSQPKVYRGNPISIEGWVRQGRIKKLAADSQLGLPHQYILWVRPKETKLGPYCIYATTLPDDFPRFSESLSSANENVRINGYFFKVRTYVAADDTVKHCPVIVATSIERIRIPSFTAVNQWQPSSATLIGALILIPLIATGFAWWVFYGSQTKQFVPGKTMSKRIDDSLHDLVDDPSVQTDREKIMSLYETESKND